VEKAAAVSYTTAIASFEEESKEACCEGSPFTYLAATMDQTKCKSIVALCLLGLLVLALGCGSNTDKSANNTVGSEKEKPIKAVELAKAFKDDRESADSKYLDKLVRVTGTVSRIVEPGSGRRSFDDEPHLILDVTLVCRFDKREAEELKSLRIGESVTILGTCQKQWPIGWVPFKDDVSHEDKKVVGLSDCVVEDSPAIRKKAEAEKKAAEAKKAK
jgi:tRNA_anti-like